MTRTLRRRLEALEACHAPAHGRIAPLVFECSTAEELAAAAAAPVPAGWRDGWGPSKIIVDLYTLCHDPAITAGAGPITF